MFFFFKAEDGIRDRSPSRGLGDVYKRQDYRGIYKVADRGVKNIQTGIYAILIIVIADIMLGVKTGYFPLRIDCHQIRIKGMTVRMNKERGCRP